MRHRGAADGLVGNTDVGDLRGHADHEREIHKVPVIGVIVLVPAWKLQASGFGAAVIVMDLYSRRIVGTAMDVRADLPLAALKMAISAQWPGAGLSTIPIGAFNMPLRLPQGAPVGRFQGLDEPQRRLL